MRRVYRLHDDDVYVKILGLNVIWNVALFVSINILISDQDIHDEQLIFQVAHSRVLKIKNRRLVTGVEKV